MKKEFSLKTFGLNLKLERIKKRLSQEKVAERLNLSTVYISNVENGKQSISLKNAFTFARFYNKSIDYLLKKHS
ncbi:helix-turn-helix transcriptional regulator [bacterium]|nr:helix-turn-helix transcriptional regulator [bacterium]